MTGALVILAALVVIGLLLYITDVKYFRHHHDASHTESSQSANGGVAGTTTAGQTGEEAICCGMHLVCEKTSLAVVSDEIIYYDDEELDRFAERDPRTYTAEEIEEFRDVMETLLPQDAPGWARSITLRKIELPEEVRDELFIIVSELRNSQPGK